jgi:hypothetical protein
MHYTNHRLSSTSFPLSCLCTGRNVLLTKAHLLNKLPQSSHCSIRNAFSSQLLIFYTLPAVFSPHWWKCLFPIIDHLLYTLRTFFFCTGRKPFAKHSSPSTHFLLFFLCSRRNEFCHKAHLLHTSCSLLSALVEMHIAEYK